MQEMLLTSIFLLVLFFLLGSGVWVGLSLLGVALTGMLLFTTRPAGDAMVTTIWTTSSSWSLTALPLFIWMGEILFRTRLSSDLFRGLAPWMNNLPGRLLHVNIAGCALFAAISGSSAATVITVGKMSIPELRRRNYPESLIIGTLAGAGTLGLLIPPSIILIVYGVTVNESITKLFIAGILPGIMLALLFMAYVMIVATLKREHMPPSEPARRWRERLQESLYLIPVILLIITVLGSIYLGIATATEAAVLGVLGSLILAAAMGDLTRANFVDSLLGATKTSSMIMLILAGSSFLSLSMGFTGLPRHLAEWIGSLQLSPLTLVLALTVFYIVLGCFLDGISSVVLTMAVVEPMVRQAGFDMIWFGIYLVVVVEMAQITPPVGFNLFVLQGMTQHQITYIARAALPMFFVMCLAVALIVAFPELVLFLPEHMLTGP
ncbi:MAG: TRAP transporter large permease subunit [Candidatus Competibacteraceae bacterium]|nr:TRAP transporter large permease subunit [Candidatus Competibacteraceae bacterium]